MARKYSTQFISDISGKELKSPKNAVTIRMESNDVSEDGPASFRRVIDLNMDEIPEELLRNSREVSGRGRQASVANGEETPESRAE